MFRTGNVTEFVKRNRREVLAVMKFKTGISEEMTLDDMFQDFCMYVVRYNTLTAFNAASANQNKTLDKQFDTWIYSCICNFLANVGRSKATKIKKRFIPNSRLSVSGEEGQGAITPLDVASPEGVTMYRSNIEEIEDGFRVEDYMDRTFAMSMSISETSRGTDFEGIEGRAMARAMRYIDECGESEHIKERLRDLLTYTTKGYTLKEIAKMQGKAKDYYSAIRKRLKALFEINDDPLCYYSKNRLMDADHANDVNVPMKKPVPKVPTVKKVPVPTPPVVEDEEIDCGI